MVVQSMAAACGALGTLLSNIQKIKPMLPYWLQRFFLRWMMSSTNVQKPLDFHPAEQNVIDALKENAKSFEVLVIWGLKESWTTHLLELTRKRLVNDKQLALIIRCNERAPGESLVEFFLKKVVCTNLLEFQQCIPRGKQITIMFDRFDGVYAIQDTKTFIIDLSDVGIDVKSFKILICVNTVTAAKGVLYWSLSSMPVRPVLPVDCCKWSEEHIKRVYAAQSNQSSCALIDSNRTGYTSSISDNAADLSSRAGCPDVQTESASCNLYAEWTLADEKLNDFIQKIWNIDGLHFDKRIHWTSLRVNV